MTDERAEAVFAASVVVGAFDRLMTRGLAAWHSSWTRRHVLRVPATSGRSDSLNTITFWSTTGLTASVAALVLLPMGATPRPLGWLVPLIGGVVSAAVALAAGTSQASDPPSR